MDDFAWPERVRMLERRRRLICIPLALAFLIVYFHRVSAGVVSDALMSEFKIARATELGILSSIYFYTYAALQLPAGILADKCGPRFSVTAGVTVAALGSWLFGWAPSLIWLYTARAVVSIGVAFVYINIVKIFAEWFRSREFGTVSGLSAFIGNAGSVMAATPLAMMVEGIGWRSSFYIIAAVSLAVAGYCWLAVCNKPADIGLPSMNEIEVREGTAIAGNIVADTSILGSLRAVAGNWYTWPPFMASAGIYGVYMALAGIWGVPYLMQIYDMPRVNAANYIVVASMGYMTGGPLVGYVSDRFRSRRLPYVVYTILATLSWLALPLWNNGKPPVEMLYLIFFLIGAGSSAASLTMACAKEVNPPHLTGMATGTVNIGPFIGAAFLQPVFGWVLDQRWEGNFHGGVKIYPVEAFYGAFWFCIAVMMIALISVLLIKETNCINISGSLAKNRDY